MKTRERHVWLVALMLAATSTSALAIQSRAADPQPETPAIETPSVTLNVDSIDIAVVLGMLSQSRRVNIIAGPEVTGNVSVNLYDVPFEEAMDAILGVAGFTWFRKGAIIHVTTEAAKLGLPASAHDLELRTIRVLHADPENILATVKEFLSPAGKAVLSKDSGSIVAQDAPDYLDTIETMVLEQDIEPTPSDLVFRSFRIDHATLEEVAASIAPFLSPEGKAVVNPLDKSIVVLAGAKTMPAIEALVADRDVPPRQVLISAHLIRVAHDDDLSLGVTFDNTRGPQEGDYFTGRGGFGLPAELTASLIGGATGVYWGGTHMDTRVFIEALATKGDVENLASPEVLVLDGQEANLIIGDKLGYKTFSRADDGTTFEKVEFLDVGTQIVATPHIASDGLVRMDITPSVSSGQIDPDSGVPVENTTEVSTTMIVKDGETIVIGGLISTLRQRVREQIPFLGDIPLLGVLFGRNVWSESKVELIVLITPHIVGPHTTPFMREKFAEAGDVSDFTLEVSPRTRAVEAMTPNP